jgi:hypothetical protein
MDSQLQRFNAQAKAEGFLVQFYREAAHVIAYEDSEGQLLFAFDLGSEGDRSLALEWSGGIERWRDASRAKTAFERAKRFLEACGYQVELWPPELEGRVSDEARSVTEQLREAVEKAGYSLEQMSEGKFVVRRETKK